MPVYEYTALDAKSKTVSGTIDAETERAARDKLRLKSVYVTKIESANFSGEKLDEDASFFEKLGSIRLGKGKATAQTGQFTRQLATLLKAGIPLTQALTALIEQIESKDMQTVVRDIRERVSQGIDFNDALQAHPFYFSPLYVSMVKAGEASGELDSVLGRVADFMQKQSKLKGKVSAALTYPAIMVFISIAVVIFLLVFVIPKITNMLRENAMEMPLVTKIVAGAGDFMVSQWYVVIGVLIAAGIFFQIWKKSEQGAYSWDKFMLKSPIFGQLFTKTAVSRFSTTLAVLLKSGLPALEGLRIVKDVVGNKVLSRVIGDVHDSIIEGTDISTPIKKSGVFPPVVGYMIAVGEQTGELENLLDRISEAYDEEVDLAVQKLTAMIEPIIIVFMAVVVGGIIAAVMLPMMQLSAGGG